MLTPVLAASAQTPGVVIALAVDFDAGKVWAAMGNVWQQGGDPASGANPFASFAASRPGALFPAVSIYDPMAGASTLQSAGVEQSFSTPAGFSPWV